MNTIILVTPLRFGGTVCCRVPGCPRHASVHVDSYMGDGADRNWDARSSGPFCSVHFSKAESSWSDCDVRHIGIRSAEPHAARA